MEEPIKKDFEYFFEEILKNIRKRPASDFIHYFLESIDEYRKLNKNYDEIIKHPVDLLMIKKKLELNQYKKPRFFFKDFKLVIQNSKTYNKNNPDMLKATRKLNSYYKEMAARFQVSLEDQIHSCGCLDELVLELVKINPNSVAMDYTDESVHLLLDNLTTDQKVQLENFLKEKKKEKIKIKKEKHESKTLSDRCSSSPMV